MTTETERTALVERLRWLADRLQADNPHFWEPRAIPLTHDRLGCVDPEHAGCHKYALVETVRSAVALLASAPSAPQPTEPEDVR
jgi:hypothetical protein